MESAVDGPGKKPFRHPNLKLVGVRSGHSDDLSVIKLAGKSQYLTADNLVTTVREFAHTVTREFEMSFAKRYAAVRTEFFAKTKAMPELKRYLESKDKDAVDALTKADLCLDEGEGAESTDLVSAQQKASKALDRALVVSKELQDERKSQEIFKGLTNPEWRTVVKPAGVLLEEHIFRLDKDLGAFFQLKLKDVKTRDQKIAIFVKLKESAVAVADKMLNAQISLELGRGDLSGEFMTPAVGQSPRLITDQHKVAHTLLQAAENARNEIPKIPTESKLAMSRKKNLKLLVDQLLAVERCAIGMPDVIQSIESAAQEYGHFIAEKLNQDDPRRVELAERKIAWKQLTARLNSQGAVYADTHSKLKPLISTANQIAES